MSQGMPGKEKAAGVAPAAKYPLGESNPCLLAENQVS